MRVLITGASGFIGRHLIDILDQDNHEIHAIYNLNKPSTDLKKVNWHQLNLFQDEQVKKFMANIKPTHVIHLAWYTEHGKFWNSEKNKDWVNATIKLFKEFKKLNGIKFISSGTKAEYFDGEFSQEHLNSSFECKEEMLASPDTIYGQSKNLLHETLQELDKENKCLVWARIFDTYGPYENNKKFCSYVIKNIKKNEDIICNNPNIAMDFLHVHDIAMALSFILHSDFLGTINISSGKSVTLKYISEYIVGKLGKEYLLKLNQDSKDRRRILGNNTLLKNIGWVPSYEIESGLNDLIKFYDNNL